MMKLDVKVHRGDIIVTAPGTSYTVTYYKPKDSPQLLARRIASTDDPRVAMTLSDFLAGSLHLKLCRWKFSKPTDPIQ